MRLRFTTLATSILIFIFSTVVYAQSNDPQLPSPPPAGSYVLDTLGWLTVEQEAQINTTVSKLDADQLAELAVVTLDDCGGDKQNFRNELFRSWGIGHADDNDGLLILVCWYGGDKSMRSLEQEVGTGLEGVIPDLLTSKVAKAYFVPVFSTGAPDTDILLTGKAGDALVAMVKAYDGVIRGSIPVELQDTPAPSAGTIWFWLIVIVIVILLLALLLAYGSSGGSGGYSSGGFTSGGFDSGSGGSSDSGTSFGGGSSDGGGSSTGF